MSKLVHVSRIWMLIFREWRGWLFASLAFSTIGDVKFVCLCADGAKPVSLVQIFRRKFRIFARRPKSHSLMRLVWTHRYIWHFFCSIIKPALQQRMSAMREDPGLSWYFTAFYNEFTHWLQRFPHESDECRKPTQYKYTVFGCRPTVLVVLL